MIYLEQGFIDEQQFNELKKIFENKKPNNYGLSKFIKSYDKNKREFYNNLSFLKEDINLPSLQIEELIRQKILGQLSEKEERLTFTFKGLLIIEYERITPGLKLNELLNDLNKIYFDNVMKLSKIPVTSREKAVIIGLLGLMTISKDYSLKPNKQKKIYIKNVIDAAAHFLTTLGKDYDDGKLEDLWTHSVVGEGPILGEFRRANQLPNRTENIYKSGKGHGHYLDILINDYIDKKKLIYLLKRIFDKRPLTYSEKKALIKTLDNIKQYEYKIFKEKPPFKVLELRKQIKNIILSDI